jgi:tungstate transport system permease protein
MDFLLDGVREAFALLVRGDHETWFGVGLSLWTSVLAITIGGLVGVPLGTALGLWRPRGDRVAVYLLRLGMSFPTVVIGLLLYGLLCRKGPLAGLDILYTPWAIVIGQALLAFPIFGSLAHAAAADLDPRAMETASTLGAPRRAILALAVSESRASIVAATLNAFGRCVTELGIALAVGGSLRLWTRTLPTLVSLETSKGEFGRGLAAGLVLVLLAAVVTAVAMAIEGKSRR